MTDSVINARRLRESICRIPSRSTIPPLLADHGALLADGRGEHYRPTFVHRQARRMNRAEMLLVDHDTVKRWSDHLLQLEYVLLSNADEATKKSASDWKEEIKAEIRRHTDEYIEDIKAKFGLDELNLDQEHRLYGSYENLGHALWVLGLGNIAYDPQRNARNERFVYDFLVRNGGSFKGKADLRRRIYRIPQRAGMFLYEVDEALERLEKRILITVSQTSPKLYKIVRDW